MTGNIMSNLYCPYCGRWLSEVGNELYVLRLKCHNCRKSIWFERMNGEMVTRTDCEIMKKGVK